jgi:hypothetical protein
MPPRGAIPRQLAVILDQTTMEKGRRPPSRSTKTVKLDPQNAQLKRQLDQFKGQ